MADKNQPIDGNPFVYVTRAIPEDGHELLEGKCTVQVWPDDDSPPKSHIIDQLVKNDAEALLCNVSDTVDEEVLDASPDLEVVSTLSVGYDHIDLEGAAERGIEVGHTPGVLTETCADLTWALLLACARRIVEAHDRVIDGKWDAWGPTVLMGNDIHDATLGIVGLGSIGTAVARRAAGFNMDLLYTHTSRQPETEADLERMGIDVEYVSQEKVFKRSDYISLHVPLLEETRGLIGRTELELMSNDAIVINTGRGELIDTDALDTALEANWIAGAALDVTDPEPLPPDHSLLRHEPEKLVVTPHIGSASIPTRNRMARMAAENILASIANNTLPNSVFDDTDIISE